MIRVADFHKVPPGGYYFDQQFERDGKRFNMHFKSHPEAGTQAARIAGFRKANNLPRATPVDALEDLGSFTCARLPEGNKWCADTDVPWATIVASQYGPNCSTCGKTS